MTSTYFLNCIMGNVFGTKTSPALPAAYYMALSTSAPSVDGTNVTEPLSSAGYARVQLDSLSVPENGVLSNTGEISFNESSASWGVVTHFAIFDAAEGGNLLMYEALTQSRSVEAATIVTFKNGSLNLTLANPA